jgi:hypothetical protein
MMPLVPGAPPGVALARQPHQSTSLDWLDRHGTE